MLQEVYERNGVDGIYFSRDPAGEQIFEYGRRCCTIIRTVDRASDLCFRRETTAHYVSTQLFRTTAIVTTVFTFVAAFYFSSLGIGYLIHRDDRPVELFVVTPIRGTMTLVPVLGIVYLLGLIIRDCRRTVANRMGDDLF